MIYYNISFWDSKKMEIKWQVQMNKLKSMLGLTGSHDSGLELDNSTHLD